MDNLISKDEAIKKLRLLCEEHGGVGAFAKVVGVNISAVSHQLNGDRPIQGKVANFMGLSVHKETIISYKKVTA